MINSIPYNSFPASTAQFEEGKNDAIQAEIDAIKDGTNIDSFGDVETALATKTDISNIAPTFDSESGTYEIGEQVIYDGVLYEFTSPHSTAGEWDSSEVQAVKISELIDTLKSGLNNLLKRGYFNIACNQGQNVFDIASAQLVSGSFPNATSDCIFQVVNHGSALSTPNTVEVDGSNTIIITAAAAQNIQVMWIQFSNIQITN